MTAEKGRIRVNGPNLRNHTLPVTGLRDFFPKDAVGGPRRKNGNGYGIELFLDGLGETVRTDIGSDANSGKARGFLRCRVAMAEVRRVAERQYRLACPNPAPPNSSLASARCGWRRNGRIGKWISGTTSTDKAAPNWQ